MSKIMFRLSGLLLFFVLVLSACNAPAADTTTPITPNQVGTAAAQTVVAQLTQLANSQATPLPGTSSTATGVPPTALPPTAVPPTAVPPTAVPPTAVPPTAVPPTATQKPVPCDRASFVDDVTIPDGTEISAGQSFVKTWRIKNTGTCTWNSSYSVVFFDKNSMGGPASFQLTAGTVAPGETVDLSVTLKAPDTTGTYEGDWKLRNGNNVLFGLYDSNTYFLVKIKVVNPTPSYTLGFDFIGKADDASWRNGSTDLNYGDFDNDGPGIAVVMENVKLNDNHTYSKALATYPQHTNNGMIAGLYPSYTVKSGDKFHAYIGFRTGCTSGRTDTFQLSYKEGSTTTVLKEWSKACNGSLALVEFDLAGLVGHDVQFQLSVIMSGNWNGDLAVWVEPRIQR